MYVSMYGMSISLYFIIGAKQLEVLTVDLVFPVTYDQMKYSDFPT